MQKYALVFFPQGDWESIQSIRKKYDTKYKVLSPHITLVFPFEDNSEEIIAHIDGVAKSLQKFPIHLHGLFKSFDDLLFLLVEDGKEEIQKLHDELYTGVLSSQINNTIPFIPHIILGDYTDQSFADAENLNIDITYTFDKITLIQGDGVSPATIIQEFSLKE